VEAAAAATTAGFSSVMFDLLLFFFLSLFPIVIYCHGNYPYDVYRDLQRESDVVVEGRVDQVFSTREKLVDDQDKDKLLKQYNLIQIFVEKVHKGEVAMQTKCCTRTRGMFFMHQLDAMNLIVVKE
jgi:hypothetical protein